MWSVFVSRGLRPAAPGVRLSEIAALLRSLATLVGAGIPLYQALDTASRQNHAPVVAEALRRAADRVLEGGRMSEVLARYPHVFSVLHVEMLRFAEEAGKIDTILALLADYAEQEVRLRQLVSRLTIYPKLLAFVAYMIIGSGFYNGSAFFAISLWVISGDTNRYLMDTLGVLAVFAVLVFLAVAVFRVLLFSRPAVARAYEQLKMALPGVGGCSRRFAFARFGRALGATYEAGIPIFSAIRIAGDACGNATIRQAMQDIVTYVERGATLSQAFGATGVFPGMVLQMLGTGEQTGNVDAMMYKVAEYLEGEAETKAHVNAFIFSVSLYALLALIIASQIIAAWGRYAAGVSGMMQ